MVDDPRDASHKQKSAATIAMADGDTAVHPEVGEAPDLGAKFELLGTIGRGGMGAIYLVRHRHLDQIRAVKVLLPGASTEVVERLRREAAVTTELAHPNIVTVYDLEELSGGQLAIVMEHLDGEDLEQVLENRGSMSVEEVLETFAGVFDALDQVHEAGVVHRDIKPSNLFRCRDGLLKILDFGVAHLAGDRQPLTATGASIGTLSYMAPEQLEGEPISQRTDVYALGAVLYQCLTGQLPVVGNTPAEVMAAILFQAPRRADEVREEIPRRAADALGKAMARNPEDRFGKASDLLAALTGEIEATALPAAVPEPQRRSGVFAITAALAVLVVVSLWLFRYVQTNPDADPYARAARDATTGEREEQEVQPIRGGTLRAAAGTKGVSLDPIDSIGLRVDTQIAALLYDTLVEMDWTGELVPSLAESWEIHDNSRRFVFRLRGNVLFHDDPCFPGGKGQMLDAADVQASLERVFRRSAADATSDLQYLPRIIGTDAYIAGEAESIRGIRVLDDRTVEIQFANAFPDFLQLLSNSVFSIVAREALHQYAGGGAMGLHVVGTGPYHLAENLEADRYLFERHVGAWHRDAAGRQLPFLDAVEVRFFQGDQALLVALQEERVDLAWGLADAALEDHAQIRGKRATLSSRWEGYSLVGSMEQTRALVAFFQVDLRDPESPLGDVRVRQALSAAIDRNQLANMTLAPAHQPLVEGMLGYVLERRETGAQRARTLLQEAGYPDGHGIPALNICALESERERMEKVRADFEQVGIPAAFQPVSAKTWDKVYREGGCDLLMSIYKSVLVRGDPTWLLLGMAGTSELGSRDPDSASILAELLETGDLERREELLGELNDAVRDDAKFIFLLHRRLDVPLYPILQAPQVRGLLDPRTNLMNPERQRLREMWIEPRDGDAAQPD